MSFAGVPDRLGQAPLGEAELLGGEQSGTGEQPAAYGGACRYRVGEAGSGGGGEGDGGERAGLVERDERLDGDAGRSRPTAYRPSVVGTSSTSAAAASATAVTVPSSVPVTASAAELFSGAAGNGTARTATLRPAASSPRSSATGPSSLPRARSASVATTALVR